MRAPRKPQSERGRAGRAERRALLKDGAQMLHALRGHLRRHRRGRQHLVPGDQHHRVPRRRFLQGHGHHRLHGPGNLRGRDHHRPDGWRHGGVQLAQVQRRLPLRRHWQDGMDRPRGCRERPRPVLRVVHDGRRRRRDRHLARHRRPRERRRHLHFRVGGSHRHQRDRLGRLPVLRREDVLRLRRRRRDRLEPGQGGRGRPVPDRQAPGRVPRAEGGGRCKRARFVRHDLRHDGGRRRGRRVRRVGPGHRREGVRARVLSQAHGRARRRRLAGLSDCRFVQRQRHQDPHDGQWRGRRHGDVVRQPARGLDGDRLADEAAALRALRRPAPVRRLGPVHPVPRLVRLARRRPEGRAGLRRAARLHRRRARRQQPRLQLHAQGASLPGAAVRV